MELLATNHTDKPIPEGLIDDVVKLFFDMKLWFKNRMTTDGLEYSYDEACLWATYLFNKGITQRDFILAKNRLLETAKKDSYPINNPQEFLNLIKESEFLTPREAFIVATSDDYNPYNYHVVIYETIRRIGEYFLKNDNERYTYPIFRDTYTQVCDEFKQGVVFSYPPNIDIEKVSISPFCNMLDNWRKNKKQK